MKRLFDYCVYRIANVYRKMGMRDYLAQGYFIMFFALTCYLLTTAYIVLYLFNIKMNETIILVLYTPLIVEIIFYHRLFPNSEAVFGKLERETAHEKHRWFKGLLVVVFLLLSLTSYVIAAFSFSP